MQEKYKNRNCPVDLCRACPGKARASRNLFLMILRRPFRLSCHLLRLAGCVLAFTAAGALGDVEGRIKCIEILAVQMILNIPQGFTEPLEMHDFPFTQESDRVADFRILYHAQDIVVS